ncbi:O-linked GlcNAc transferase [Lysinibacillus sp. 54212]|uniref:O-linked GlcNAc transferase n=1 Tax=Lysinibacillus sp. 54212 TaxID=3119829 RepID=UPI002FC73D9A
MHTMEQYFYSGQFHLSLQEAREALQDDRSSQQASQLIQLYNRHELDSIPLYTNIDARQSEERADETYEEQDEVHKIREIQDESTFNERVKELEKVARVGQDIEKAQSFFTQGQLFLFAHHYDESVHCMLQAVKWNPNKAVFYGIAAQTMHRFGWSPFEVLGYLERAIELDAENARWYWNKGLVLTQLYKDLKQDPFLENALITLEKALESCRPQQRSLKIAIENTLDNMRDYVLE